MGRHSLDNLSLYDRLVNLEHDMTEIHDAISRLSQRIEELSEVVRQREQSHVNAVNAQVDRADQIIAQFRDGPTAMEHQAPEVSADPSHNEGLLDPSPPSHY